ncbi:Germ Cell-Specific 1-Like Protein 2 [Manis pentadactyla]|nr:Germ Cell-Specific 1-Like Protein 2 [Manis pentadactyla]
MFQFKGQYIHSHDRDCSLDATRKPSWSDISAFPRTAWNGMVAVAAWTCCLSWDSIAQLYVIRVIATTKQSNSFRASNLSTDQRTRLTTTNSASWAKPGEPHCSLLADSIAVSGGAPISEECDLSRVRKLSPGTPPNR